jgi:hypothetical protein
MECLSFGEHELWLLLLTGTAFQVLPETELAQMFHRTCERIFQSRFTSRSLT